MMQWFSILGEITRDRGHYWGFPGALVVKNLLPMQETQDTQVWSLGWEDPLETEVATHSKILGWKIPLDRGAWWATVHGVTKSQMQLIY